MHHSNFNCFYYKCLMFKHINKDIYYLFELKGRWVEVDHEKEIMIAKVEMMVVKITYKIINYSIFQ